MGRNFMVSQAQHLTNPVLHSKNNMQCSNITFSIQKIVFDSRRIIASGGGVGWGDRAGYTTQTTNPAAAE